MSLISITDYTYKFRNHFTSFHDIQELQAKFISETNIADWFNTLILLFSYVILKNTIKYAECIGLFGFIAIYRNILETKENDHTKIDSHIAHQSKCTRIYHSIAKYLKVQQQ